MTAQVAVVGASGFVGRAVVERLRHHGAVVIPVKSPRVSGTVGASAPSSTEVSATAALFGDATCVINAAGISDALQPETETLDGANGLLPGLLARACEQRKARLVHISSSAVQGRLPLDSREVYASFSPYSRSKAIGEQAVLASTGDVCVFRPPGVHDGTRQVTQSVIRLARSPLSSVASPATDNAPHAQLLNVADAIAFLALYVGPLPRIVHMSSEGIGTAALLTALGGRHPVAIPRSIARLTVSSARLAGRLSSRISGHARRLEILWLGQRQADSWLNDVGWAPPVGPEGWKHMAAVTDQEEVR